MYRMYCTFTLGIHSVGGGSSSACLLSEAPSIIVIGFVCFGNCSVWEWYGMYIVDLLLDFPVVGGGGFNLRDSIIL